MSEPEETQVYDRVYCSSDWHNPPDKLSDVVAAFLKEAKRGQAEAGLGARRVLVVGVGDLFELALNGWTAFVSGQAIQQFADELEGLDFVYVAGNHDPPRWVRKVMNHLGRQVRLVNHLSVSVGGHPYHFVHGDRWDRRARWLRPATNLLIWLDGWEPLRRLLQWFLDRLTPTPGALKHRIWRLQEERESQPRSSEGWQRRSRDLQAEKERYDEAIGWIHGGAGRHAETNDCVVICGHTHKPWKGLAFKGEQPVLRMHDDGDLLDSCTYLVIEGRKATLHRLLGRVVVQRLEPQGWLRKVLPRP
jgi:UDP-2,3-diacylglucosamine pyrophosphatase LpxH